MSSDYTFLAVAYNDLALGRACHGEWDAAIKLLKESRRIRENLPGFTRDKLWSPQYHLGMVYSHQGKYDKAEKVINECIDDWVKIYGQKKAVSIR